MDRKPLIDLCFQHGAQLILESPEYRQCVDDLLNWMLTSDDIEHDVTTDALHLRERVTASIQSRQSGIIAGIKEILFLLGKYRSVRVEQHIQDGATVQKGDAVLTFSAEIGTVLGLERTVLNVIGRMSGIATQTNRLVQLAAKTPGGPQIAGIRKTPWMLLDKKAIYRGGGLTHRLNLSDSILIKDNHLFALRQQLGGISAEETVQKAVERVASHSSAACFEIEVEGVAQAKAALSTYREVIDQHSSAPTMVIMLDNFTPADAGHFIGDVRSDPLYERILFEASGDITEETLPTWATTGVDVVSLGALTHSSKNFNASMALS